MSRAANRGSLLVGAGIFLSRIAGLLREMVSGRVLGNSARRRIGHGLAHPESVAEPAGRRCAVGSFVPVYSDALEHDDRREPAGSPAPSAPY